MPPVFKPLQKAYKKASTEATRLLTKDLKSGLSSDEVVAIIYAKDACEEVNRMVHFALEDESDPDVRIELVAKSAHVIELYHQLTRCALSNQVSDVYNKMETYLDSEDFANVDMQTRTKEYEFRKILFHDMIPLIWHCRKDVLWHASAHLFVQQKHAQLIILRNKTESYQSQMKIKLKSMEAKLQLLINRTVKLRKLHHQALIAGAGSKYQAMKILDGDEVRALTKEFRQHEIFKQHLDDVRVRRDDDVYILLLEKWLRVIEFNHPDADEDMEESDSEDESESDSD